MTNDRGVGLLAMTSPMSAILSADVTSPKLSHLAVWREGVHSMSLVKVLRVCSFYYSSFLVTASWLSGTGFKLDSNEGRKGGFLFPASSGKGVHL